MSRTNELAPSEEIIEGEFTAESGYYCWTCNTPLNVGSVVCPQCGQQFTVPTPTLVRGRIVQTQEQLEIMKQVMRGRVTEPLKRKPYYKPKTGWEYGDPSKKQP